MRIIRNGIAGDPIKHGQGLRQGDPVSPLLFVIAIDPLQRILEVATRKGLLHKIRGRGAMMWTSLYADDAAVFLAPIKRDVDNLANILRGFGEVTGLCTNFQKSWVVPIRCRHLHHDTILQNFPAARASFPIKYLGLPLLVWQLKVWDFPIPRGQCRFQTCSMGWKKYHNHWSGCPCQVCAILTSHLLHHPIDRSTKHPPQCQQA